MAQTSRLEQELADALGVTQAVRAAATAARAQDGTGRKLGRRLAEVESELAVLQERVNELVVASPATRTALTARSRRLRDTERTAQEGRVDGDALDALQALAAEAAFALAQWTVVRRLARAAGHKPARRLAKLAVPAAEQHLAVALEGVDRVAKRRAAAAAG